MTGICKRSARVTFFLVGALAALTLTAGVARAETSDTSALIGTGSLRLSTPLHAGTFAGSLDGTPHVLDGVGFGGFIVEDSRGSGVGWQVTMVAGRFNHEGLPGKGLALGSLSVPVLTVAKADDGSSDVPGLMNEAAAIDTGGAGVVVAACSTAGQGMGSYSFDAGNGARWKLSISSDEFAGRYNSTITTTLATRAL